MQDQLEAIWDQILKITAVFVTPNWGDPIGWLPVLLVVGVVGPLLSILVLFWVWYLIRKPRVRYEYADASRPAQRDAAGDYLFPTGEPHCPRDGLIFEPRVSRCDVCGDPLRVVCPKCLVVRAATDTRCGNCGLAFTLQPTVRTARRSPGPPPGGAAVA